MKNVRLTSAAVLTVASLTASASAHAAMLLNIIDAPAQDNTPYALTFIATAPGTTISIGGYQLPASENSTDNGVYLNGSGPNLLAEFWDLTPADFGTDSFSFDDGSDVQGLYFAGVTVGSYDVWSQTIATTVGSSYTIDLQYSNYDYSTPSGFEVFTNAAVPEPATWALMLVGVGGMGAAMRMRRRAAVAIA